MLNRKKKNKKQNQLKDYKRGKKLFIKNKWTRTKEDIGNFFGYFVLGF
jgi:hypothetical protein